MSRRLHVEFIGPAGAPMPREAPDSLYASDLHFEPVRRKWEDLPDGTVEIEAPPSPVALHATISVPDFGVSWVTADNEGEGYGRRTAAIDFVREAAASRLADVQRVMAERGVPWSAGCRAHADAAEDCLTSAAKASGARRAALRLASLSHGLWAGELAVVERARHRIAQGRKRKGFLFGCNTFTSGRHVREVRRRFSKLLNFGTLPFYLASLERQQDKPDYSRVDEMLAWCERDGIAPKGHPLWWGHEAGIPEWLKGADWEAAQRHCRRVAARSVQRYRDRIKVWDAINEAHDWANGLGLTHEQEVAITRVACEAVRATDPDATVIVNNCCPFGEYAAYGVVHLGPVFEKVFTPLSYLDALMEAGVDFDVVGVQVYFPARDMLAISKLLDEFARFGKPVHITELGVSSGEHAAPPKGDAGADPAAAPCQWHQPWCEKVQADWAEWFYTMCYARPEVQAITWWDFADPAFIPTAGFVREDGTPKESYHRVRALLRQWGLGR